MRTSPPKSRGIIAALFVTAVFSVLIVFTPLIALLASLLTMVACGGILIAEYWLSRGSRARAGSKKATLEHKDEV